MKGGGMTYLLVALGSALGGTLRYWLSGLIGNWFGQSFPWGTLIVNVSGSFVIGFFATLTAADGRLFVPSEWRQFFMAGICGGYTTFSSFSYQTLTLAQDGEWLFASMNVMLSVALCLLGVWLGAMGAMLLNK
jgi:CrcB protein